MNERYTDPEHVDPLAGSGISEDNYEDKSWADEDTPWDDPEVDRLTEDDHARGASDDPDEQLARLTQDIRTLEDAQLQEVTNARDLLRRERKSRLRLD